MNREKERNRSLFQNAAWLLGGNSAAGIFEAIEAIVIVRMLGVSDYGLLALIVAYVKLLNAFFDFGVWETVTKYLGTFWSNGEHAKSRSIIKLSYAVDISSGIIAFLIAILTANIANKYLIHSPQAHVLLSIYAFTLLFNSANTTSDAILRVFDKFKKIAFINSLQVFSRFSLVTIALLLGMGIKGIIFSFILANFLGFSIRFWSVSKTIHEHGLQGWWKAKLFLIKDQWKGIAWFLSNTSFLGTLQMASDRFLGILVLGFFSGKDAVAYYKLARTIVNVMTRISDPLDKAIYPELVRIFNQNALEEFLNLIKYSLRTLLKFTIPLAIITLILTEQIIMIIFGKEFLPAVNALRVLTVTIVISQLTFWISPALLAIGKPGLRTFLEVISYAIYIGLLFLLVPNYSYMGAAIAFLGYAIVKTNISFLSIRSSMNEKKRLLLDEVPSQIH